MTDDKYRAACDRVEELSDALHSVRRIVWEMARLGIDICNLGCTPGPFATHSRQRAMRRFIELRREVNEECLDAIGEDLDE